MRTDDFDYNLPEELIASRMAFDCQAFTDRQDDWSVAADAAKACMDFYRENMTDFKLNAITHTENAASRNVLEKIGFEVTETFHLDMWNLDCFWYELKK